MSKNETAINTDTADGAKVHVESAADQQRREVLVSGLRHLMFMEQHRKIARKQGIESVYVDEDRVAFESAPAYRSSRK